MTVLFDGSAYSRITGNALVHWVATDKHFMAPFNCRWKRSTWRLAIGWYGVVQIYWVPRKLMRCFHSDDTNCWPWSFVMVEGTLNKVWYPSTPESLGYCAWRAVLYRQSFGHRVNQSVYVSRYVQPWDVSSDPTRLVCTWSNLALGVLKVPGDVIVWWVTLALWHRRQNHAHLQTSAFIPD